VAVVEQEICGEPFCDEPGELVQVGTRWVLRCPAHAPPVRERVSLDRWVDRHHGLDSCEGTRSDCEREGDRRERQAEIADRARGRW
jgi:hypothetical protein